MRTLTRILLLLVATAVATVALLAAALQERPLVAGTARLSPSDIERAKRVLSAHDPRRAGRHATRSLAIEERDLALALNYLASQKGRGAASASLRAGQASLRATFEVAPNPFGRYLNIEVRLGGNGAVPRIDRLTVGRVPVPGFVAEFLLPRVLHWLMPADGLRIAAGVVQSARLEDGRVVLTYRWTDEAAALARSVLVAPEDLDRLRAYHERLADTLAAAPATVSLAALMPPLFQLALERGAGADQARENRAAIVVLALYVIGMPPARIAPAAAQWPRPARRAVLLAGRDDFPKHFLVSAAIAAEAGSPLADAIGIQKEIEDSRGGSGLSFRDIGANRAGTRFGEEAASREPPRAQRLARAVAAGIDERDLMPDVSDLPESLSDAEVEKRFGGIGGARYGAMLAEIDARIAALPLLRR
jgi:hypothetical protein